MKKSEFLEMIDESTLEQSYSDLYNKYYESYNNLLMTFERDQDIKLDTLQKFEKKGKFEIFVRENFSKKDKEAVKNCLAEIEAQLKQWIEDNKWLKNNKDEPIAHFSDEWSKTDKQYKKRQKVSEIVHIVFIVSFVSFAVVMAVFGILDNFSIFEYGGQVAGLCGIFDFINGVAFFVYEKIDDRRTKKEAKNIENAYETLKRGTIEQYNRGEVGGSMIQLSSNGDAKQENAPGAKVTGDMIQSN